jgi:hypothetical protein
MMTTKQHPIWNYMNTKPASSGWFAILLPGLALALTFLLSACGNGGGTTVAVGVPAAATPSTAPLAVNQPKVSKVVTDQGEQVEFNEAPPLNDGVPAFISIVTVG